MNSDQTLDRVFHALADTTRRKILAQASVEELTVNEIAAQFQMSLPAISKHLKVLENSGLLRRRKEGKHRMCRTEPQLLADAYKWLAYYEEFWNDNLDKLKHLLENQELDNSNTDTQSKK